MTNSRMTIRATLVLAALLLPLAAGAGPDVGDAKRGERLYTGEETIEGVAACHTCHGKDGNETQGATFPRLAGQYPDYMLHALQDYKSGARVNPVMNPMAQKLSKKDMQDVTRYIGEMPGKLADLSQAD